MANFKCPKCGKKLVTLKTEQELFQEFTQGPDGNWQMVYQELGKITSTISCVDCGKSYPCSKQKEQEIRDIICSF